MIKRENVADVYPLTPFQEGLFFRELVEHSEGRAGAHAHRMQLSFRLRGLLDLDAFDRAWQGLIDRHTVLRTAFPQSFKDRPLQVVLRQCPFSMARHPRPGLSEDQRAWALREYAEAERSLALPLDSPPLMRVTCLAFAEDDHGLVWAFHHILMDGWCIAILQQDLSRLYASAVAGTSIPGPSSLPFARYVSWLEARRKVCDVRRWQSVLGGTELRPVALPGRRIRVAGLQRRPASQALTIGPVATGALQGIARTQRCTLSDVLHALWGAFLSRLGDTSGVLFGSVRAVRPTDLPGVDSMVGPTIGMVPVCVHCPGGANLLDVLSAMAPQRAIWLEQPVDPLPEILRASGLERDAISHFLVVENYPLSASFEGDLQGFAQGVALHDFEFWSVNDYDFYVRATPLGAQGVRIEFEHDANAFEAGAIQTLAARFEHFSHAIAQQPAQPIATVDLRSDAERALIRQWSVGPARQPAHLGFLSLWTEGLRTYGSHPALRWSGSMLTYRELHAAAARVARHLRAAGAVDGDVVALPAQPGPALVCGIIGCHLLGLPFLPVDLQWPAAHRDAVLRDSGARWMYGDIPPDWHDLSGITPLAAEGEWVGGSTSVGDTSAEWPTPDGAGKAAYLIYTSGTTGKPKGVAVGMRSLINYTSWVGHALGVGPGSASVLLTSAAYDLGYTAVFGALFNGACLSMLDESERRDPQSVVRCIVEHRLTFLKATPSYFAMLWNSEPWQSLRPDQHRLAHVLLGGEAQDFALLSKFHAAHPKVRVWNHYGPTEATVGCIAGPLDDLIEEGREVQRLGRPIPGATVLICDAALHPVGPGSVGEILLGGDILALGYQGHAAGQDQRFLTLQGFEGGPRFYRTGDYAEWSADGTVIFHGRRDDQVKVQGYRASLSDISAAVKSLPGIVDACVVPEGQALIAFVVAPGAPDLDASGWRRALGARLTRALVPGRFVFVPRLPLTPNGKIDRRALRQAIVTDDLRRQVLSEAPAVPMSELEAEVCAAFREVLGRESVLPDDDFFALGGHSLSAIRLGSSLRRIAKRKTPLLAVFDAPTPRALARLLTAGDGTGPAPRLTLMRGAHAPRSEVVFFPSLLGTPLLFQGVASRLSPGLRCWGVAMGRSEDAAERGPDSLEALADRMASVIDNELPADRSGHLTLVGWSFGAYLASETARRLLRTSSGKRVRLVLIDIPPRCNAVDTPSERLPSDEELLTEIQRHLGTDADEADKRQGLDTVRRHLTMLQHYRLRDPLPCDVVTIEATGKGRVPFMQAWDQWVDGRCVHRSLDADHHGIVMASEHASLAALVEEALGRSWDS